MSVSHPVAPSPVKVAPRRPRSRVPRRELLTLLAYLEAGSHKAAAHRLGVSEATSRQRIWLLLKRVGVRNTTQAVWALRHELQVEQDASDIDVRRRLEQPFDLDLGTATPGG